MFHFFSLSFHAISVCVCFLRPTFCQYIKLMLCLGKMSWWKAWKPIKVDSRNFSLSNIFQNPWIIGILYKFHRCSVQIKSGNMTSINGSKYHWKSISLVVYLLVCVCSASNAWQENVRPKLYVELGEYIHKIIIIILTVGRIIFLPSILKQVTLVRSYIYIIQTLKYGDHFPKNKHEEKIEMKLVWESESERCMCIYRIQSLTFRSSGKITEIE